MSKRSQLASAMERLGLTRVLEWLPAKPGILIVNHHRIGDASGSRFDHGVFSATTDELDHQVRALKRDFPILGGEELESLVQGGKPLRHFHVAFTFDDGYRDNYTNAFPVLRAHGVPGHFFLIPTYTGTPTIPWWDAIAFFVRNTAHRELVLPSPVPLTVRVEGDREAAILAVLRHYKRPDNYDGDAFLAALAEAADVELPTVEARFLTWDEAKEMQAAGMTIGSHTLTHRILAQLPEAEQEHELRASRAILEDRLGTPVRSLAYPVGITTAFTDATRRIARDAGYTVCLSFYGGINTPAAVEPTNVLRTSLEADRLLFRNQAAMLSHLGRLPY